MKQVVINTIYNHFIFGNTLPSYYDISMLVGNKLIDEST